MAVAQGRCQGGGRRAIVAGMSKQATDQRAERLAQALRANLLRRKAQARELADTAPPPEPDTKD